MADRDDIAAESAYERDLEAIEDAAIEQALAHGEARECPTCRQLLGPDEPCPDCERP
jgi:hypothetical protein